MYSSSNRKNVHTLSKTVEMQETERRIAERHMFTASAEVIELALRRAFLYAHHGPGSRRLLRGHHRALPGGIEAAHRAAKG